MKSTKDRTMKKHYLLSLLLLAACGTEPIEFAETRFPEATLVPAGFRYCPGGTTSSRRLILEGEHTGYICCRYDRCSVTDPEGEPLEP